MPPLPAVPKTILIKLFWTIGVDIRGLTRFYASYTGAAPSQAQMAAYATTVFNEVGTALAPEFPASVKLTEVQCIDLSSAVGANGVATGSTPGTRAGVALPGATAALENDQLARRYRGGHPRLYWPFGVAADLTDAQDWSAAALAAFNAALTAFYNFIFAPANTWPTAGAVSRSNVSYYAGFTSVQNPRTLRWRNVPNVRANPLIDAIITATINPRPGYQRRRGLHSV